MNIKSLLKGEAKSSFRNKYLWVALGTLLALTKPASAAVTIDLDSIMNRPIDNKVVINAGSADVVGLNLREFANDPAKNYWWTGFDSLRDSITWTVRLKQPTTFKVELMVSGSIDDEFTLTVLGAGNKSVLHADPSTGAVSYTNAGSILIPAGTQRLRLTKSVVGRGGISSSTLKSIELTRESDVAAYQKRVKSFQGEGLRRKSKWMRGQRGYFVQWGGWSYPYSKADKPDFETIINEFDVDKFVEDVKRTRSTYVIWSVTWIDYLFPAPIKAIDRILGNSSRTSRRDLLGEVARALDKNDIRLIAYYHTGKDIPDWWAPQDFPEDFRFHGAGARTKFFNNWKSVISEVGRRYGTLLDGWMFDDGLVYYPAPFEELGAVARLGNRNRLVSWNSFTMARYTDFQDFTFGEASFGCKRGAPTDKYGIITAGGQKGLFNQCIWKASGTWGIYQQGQSLSSKARKPEWFEEVLGTYVPESGAMAINYLMWNGPAFVPGMAAAAEKGYLLANPVQKVEVGYDGTIFGIKLDGQVSTYDADTTTWNAYGAARVKPGDGVAITDKNNLWLAGHGWAWQRSKGRWIKHGPRRGGSSLDFVDFSVGIDGTAWGMARLPKRSYYSLYKNTGRHKWRSSRAAVRDISVRNANDMLLVGSTGHLYHWNGRSYTRILLKQSHLRFSKIDYARDGLSTWGVLTDGRLVFQKGNTWYQFGSPAVKVKDIAVKSSNDIYVIDSEGVFMHYNGSEWSIVPRHSWLKWSGY